MPLKRNETLKDVGLTIGDVKSSTPDGSYAIAIGMDLAGRVQCSQHLIAKWLVDVVHGMQDTQGSIGMLGDVRFYVIRRGNTADAGTRADFADLGWTSLCDQLDKMAERY